LNLSIT